MEKKFVLNRVDLGKRVTGYDLIELSYQRDLQEIERKAFENKRLHGKQAHAYKHEYDNLKILSLRDHRKTFREIAKAIGCSPSTVRNRIRKMGRR